jgi:hypothetical protein
VILSVNNLFPLVWSNNDKCEIVKKLKRSFPDFQRLHVMEVGQSNVFVFDAHNF